MVNFVLTYFGSILYFYKDQWNDFFLTLDRISYISYEAFPTLKSLFPNEEKIWKHRFTFLKALI